MPQRLLPITSSVVNPFASRPFAGALAFLILTACTNSEPNKFSDENLVRIAGFQDKRLTDSLRQFITHPNEVYRREAAMAFASLQDSTSSLLLAERLLSDEDVLTRVNAAYALGQVGGREAVHALLEAVERETDSFVMQTALEALGKVADGSDINLEKYKGDGVPWLCYRLGQRQATPPELTQRAMLYLPAENTAFARLGAAHFFARSVTEDISDASEVLIHTLGNDPSADVRMATAWALRKIVTDDVFAAVSRAATEDGDYRVRVNALKSLAYFPFDRTRDLILGALHDSESNVAIAAAEVIQSAVNEADVAEVLREARSTSNWRVQALLFQGVNALVRSADINTEIIDLYSSSANNYQKAWLLSALSSAAMSFVSNELLTTHIPVIRSSAARALVVMNRQETISPVMQEEFLSLYRKGIGTGDVAVIGIITDALTDSALHYRQVVMDIAFLNEARSRLSLPRDYESYVPLENAIAYFEGREPTEVEKSFNHPVNWDLVRRIPKQQEVRIETSKGDIVISLLVEHAPGSVANFVGLVIQHYFDGKFFHRVVPNFVVQDGCNRGDGWGSEDYSIRSEFNGLRYAAGSVGMASAGKDTEGTQWFITHSPTPHLDGRYSQFATVVEGMEVMHALEVGDTIHSMELTPPLAP